MASVRPRHNMWSFLDPDYDVIADAGGYYFDNIAQETISSPNAATIALWVKAQRGLFYLKYRVDYSRSSTFELSCKNAFTLYIPGASSSLTK